MLNAILLGLLFSICAAHAGEQVDTSKSPARSKNALDGRAALDAILGHKVVFHESIGHDVVWLFRSDNQLTIEVKGKKFEGQFRDAENGAICTSYRTLENISVCYRFILRDNRLTKIDLASQIGNEGEVANAGLPKTE
jgi:hypothetical protein